MATRGRPNVNKAPAKKAAVPAPKANPKKPASSGGGLIGLATKAAGTVLGMTSKGKKGGAGGKKRVSARQRLRRAYERRAIRQIHQGMLGQARRTLRKKATVM
jgi:hypothetical protein